MPGGGNPVALGFVPQVKRRRGPSIHTNLSQQATPP
jgi:hypothetical protein